MLLPIRPETARCAIFSDLNREVGRFLTLCVLAEGFSGDLFSEGLLDAIMGNDHTREKFEALWDVIEPLTEGERNNLVSEFDRVQFVQRYYEDKDYPLPVIAGEVGDAIARLTKHLFGSTTKLVGIENACHETLHENFDGFRNINKNICCFCGASELAQVRAGVDVNDQWMAANDHLLSKALYPIFGVHPDNLIPLCETCNSKAKLAKSLIIKKRKGHPDERRLCFFPFVESCSDYVGIQVDQGELRLAARFTTNTPDPTVQERIDTWNDVYSIEGRVEGKFADLAVLADNDCTANDLNEFRQMIQEKAASCKTNCRLESWSFWKYRLYEWLDTSGNGIVDALWDSITDKRNDPDAAEIYGI